MSIADQIRRIKNAKAAIKEAIQNKGVTVSDTAKLDEYPALIYNISGSDSEYMNPNFYELRTNGGTSYRGLFCYFNITNFDASSFCLDSSNVTDMTYMFTYGGQQIGTITGLHSLDYSKVKYINHMFYYSEIGGTIDLSGISFPEVINASYMFNGIQNVQSIDMTNVDMPKVTNAISMFSLPTNSKTTSINLSGINMPNITNADNMFSGCNKITELDLSGINFSKTTNIGSMFSGCKLLVEIMGEIDLSKISSGLYSTAYSNPFRTCNALETVWLKNIYKDVATMNVMETALVECINSSAHPHYVVRRGSTYSDYDEGRNLHCNIYEINLTIV